jgi:hypothetical protein
MSMMNSEDMSDRLLGMAQIVEMEELLVADEGRHIPSTRLSAEFGA